MTPSDTQPHRILVIDDITALHDDFRKILAPKSEARHRLEALGARLLGNTAVTPASTAYRIDTATQGQAGLALVKQALAAQDPYLLAFVDIRMPPGWDGVENIQADNTPVLTLEKRYRTKSGRVSEVHG
jgi:CheY-like chemotaxis protein